jgi:hypothetical protein
MFQAAQQPFKPFAIPSSRKQHWYDLRPSGLNISYRTEQYFNCDEGPTTSDSFEEKYEAAVAFFRSWFVTEKPRPIKEFSFRLRLTFSNNGELVPESIYPLVALYEVLREARVPPNIRRINVFLTKTHWFLWRGSLDDEVRQIELPLEAAADWGRVGKWIGLDVQEDVAVAAEQVLPGCRWMLPRVLAAVLTPYLSYLGLAANDHMVTWQGIGVEELTEAAALLPPLPFRF